MKKLVLVLAISAAFVACNNNASTTEAKMDSTSTAIDSSMNKTADSAKASIDSTASAAKDSMKMSTDTSKTKM